MLSNIFLFHPEELNFNTMDVSCVLNSDSSVNFDDFVPQNTFILNISPSNPKSSPILKIEMNYEIKKN